MTTFVSQLVHIVQSNLEGALILLALILVPLVWSRATRSARAGTTPYPYVRGSELYYRSLAHRDVAPPSRQAMGLPPYHHEAEWRDPPG